MDENNVPDMRPTNHAVDMFKVGNGAFRKVEAFHLSRMACMIISENADSRKLLVKQARAYFSQSVSTTEIVRNSLESNILLYKTAQGETRIEVIFNNETFWMSQKRMAALFGVDRATITYHISQIYESGELQREATCRKIQQVQLEGERNVERAPLFYNLDVIIAVGYRVNSYQATQFRIWATSVLKEFIIKGYVLDDERLKQGKHFGKDYFDDLLERIREIRTSERRYYQKITDIYAECSADYDAKAESTKLFYKMVQNMMHLPGYQLTHLSYLPECCLCLFAFKEFILHLPAAYIIINQSHLHSLLRLINQGISYQHLLINASSLCFQKGSLNGVNATALNTEMRIAPSLFLITFHIAQSYIHALSFLPLTTVSMPQKPLSNS